jgi:hypothetical protein
VPMEKRGKQSPCCYIPLDDQGKTVDLLYRSGTAEELESTVRHWLTRKIEQLEQAGTLVTNREQVRNQRDTLGTSN